MNRQKLERLLAAYADGEVTSFEVESLILDDNIKEFVFAAGRGETFESASAGLFSAAPEHRIVKVEIDYAPGHLKVTPL